MTHTDITPTGILVFGMHRSGTSALTRIINLLGANISDDLLAKNSANERGYWESARFVKLSTQLFSELESSWDDWRPLPQDERAQAIYRRFRAEFAELISECFDGSPLFVLKDPRLSRLAPLVTAAVVEAGYTPKVVSTIRHPAEVGASLAKRDRMTSAHAALLWLRHSLIAEQGSRGIPRSFVRFDALFEDWRAATRKISTDLGLVWPRSAEQVAPEVEAFLDPSLKHHWEADTPAHNTDVHPWLADAYQALLRLTTDPGGSGAQTELDRIAEDLARSDPLFAPLNNGDQISPDTKPQDTQPVLSHLVNELSNRLEAATIEMTLLKRRSRPALLRLPLFRHPRRTLAQAADKFLSTLGFGRRGVGQIDLESPAASGLSKVATHHGKETLQRVRGYLELIGRFRSDPENFERSDELSQLLESVRVQAANLKLLPPEVSVIIPVHNRLTFTLTCLSSLFSAGSRLPYEILIGDDASDEPSRLALASVGGPLRPILQATKLGFVGNANATARHAHGRHVVLVHNDTLMLPGWLDELIGTLEEFPEVGLAGPKLLNSDGSLQEAGCIVWKDGSTWKYGRGEDPLRPEFNYFKDVDYCSSAALAVPRQLWERLGGFDPIYSPDGSEDSDLAFRIRQAGYRTVHQPFSAIIHHGGILEPPDQERPMRSYQITNQARQAERWHAVLRREHFATGRNVHVARDRSRNKPHILFVNPATPRWSENVNADAIFGLMRFFASLDFQVSFWSDDLQPDSLTAESLERSGIEFVHSGDRVEPFDSWLERRSPWISYVVLCGFNASRKYLQSVRTKCDAGVIFYGIDFDPKPLDVENLASITESSLVRRTMRTDDRQACLESDGVICTSEFESEMVLSDVKTTAAVVPRTIFSEEYLAATERHLRMASRRDPHELIFVGGFDFAPNGLIWLIKRVLPKLRNADSRFHLSLVGDDCNQMESMAGDGVKLLPRIADIELEALYRRAGAAIVPLRSDKDAPAEMIEALARGVPVICSPVTIQGLGNLAFVADDEATFVSQILRATADSVEARKRSLRAIDFVRRKYSTEAALMSLAPLIPEVVHAGRFRRHALTAVESPGQ